MKSSKRKFTWFVVVGIVWTFALLVFFPTVGHAAYPKTKAECGSAGGSWVTSGSRGFCYMHLSQEQGGNDCTRAGGVVERVGKATFCLPRDPALNREAKMSISTHGEEGLPPAKLPKSAGQSLQQQTPSLGSASRSEVRAQLATAAAGAGVRIDDENFVYTGAPGRLLISTTIAGADRYTLEELRRPRDVLVLYSEGTEFPDGFYVVSVSSDGSTATASLRGSGGEVRKLAASIRRADGDALPGIKVTLLTRPHLCLIIETKNRIISVCNG